MSEIEKTPETIEDALEITEERKDFLMGVLSSAYQQSDHVSDLISILATNEDLSSTELSYLSFIAGRAL